MGKRSDFIRKPRDFYATPEKALLPLLPHLDKGQRFIEPCAGEGDLIKHLENHSHMCVGAYDIFPMQDKDIKSVDATEDIYWANHLSVDSIITNPPWDRKIMHKIISNAISSNLPVWLLIDYNWAATKQAVPYLKYCEKIVIIGRVKWIPDSKMVGKDDAAWYLFHKFNDKHPVLINER